MDTNNQVPTKEQVKEFMRNNKSGAKIAEILKAYFSGNRKPAPVPITENPQRDIYDIAKDIFGDPVDNRGPVIV